MQIVNNLHEHKNVTLQKAAWEARNRNVSQDNGNIDKPNLHLRLLHRTIWQTTDKPYVNFVLPPSPILLSARTTSLFRFWYQYALFFRHTTHIRSTSTVGSDCGSGGSKGTSSGGIWISFKVQTSLWMFSHGLFGLVFTWTGPGFYIVVLSWRSILAVTAGQTPLTILRLLPVADSAKLAELCTLASLYLTLQRFWFGEFNESTDSMLHDCSMTEVCASQLCYTCLILKQLAFGKFKGQVSTREEHGVQRCVATDWWDRLILQDGEGMEGWEAWFSCPTKWINSHHEQVKLRYFDAWDHSPCAGKNNKERMVLDHLGSCISALYFLIVVGFWTGCPAMQADQC